MKHRILIIFGVAIIIAGTALIIQRNKDADRLARYCDTVDESDNGQRAVCYDYWIHESSSSTSEEIER